MKDGSFSKKCFDETTQKVLNKITLRKHIESTTAKFFGIHGFAYLSTKMWSNIMSYFVLQRNAVHPNSTLNSTCLCGAEFCNEKNDCFSQNLQEPTMDDRYLLTGICIGLGLISITILALFLDTLDDRNGDITFSFNFLLATGKQLKKLNAILLTPISFYIGMVQGFYAGDFNLVIISPFILFHVMILILTNLFIIITMFLLTRFLVCLSGWNFVIGFKLNFR